ncbi:MULTISPECIES: glucosaminidase domain-containing protein [unclassified Breznakia]|uniref:glucosaminidase domain-containing protein n=1 Tax=unclassified Breznakia TaxID=2623764 RepID=UPI00247313E0|nr:MULTISPECIES: glucosaminidase domain-containing protein [unclassified Breznakia]MDH6367887.1 beta-N-acetylglucosaminidase [Breznakia sp. PH1-1]MDH6404975.1 beta-N-acetylglucosaminidase [Breznakia sp. PF1-11]MDH6412714.1 beta-N-acetylglucosaminidase [Breznakia sp. PFB1-11]MDH6415050.1 beta-N-acetylglucosaminidase [Breznakia sp. PFB1-14]MDH6417361.1 beta-N-acetylglucosaminidase [Breznakia sp. PFB1-4]
MVKNLLKKISIFSLLIAMLTLCITNTTANYVNLKEGDSNEEFLTFITAEGEVVTVDPDTKAKRITPQLENVGAAASSLDVVRFTYYAGVTNYTDYNTGTAGYLSAGYIEDAAFVKYEGDYVIAIMSGAKIKVAKDKVQVLPLSSTKSTSFYRKENGVLKHYIASDITQTTVPYANQVGPGLANMQENVKYFSYDGHYFWTDYSKMLSDYRAGTYGNSINNGNPYYNYFQFLSHRSYTAINGPAIDYFVLSNIGSQRSVMNGQGQNFVDSQNKYGTNALLMVGVAINESNWGTSSLALSKNNLFGHSAYDSNPNNATPYANAKESINYHASTYVSNYSKPTDWKYFGSHLGDKQSGMNIKYASDPFWGEKAAHHAWSISNMYPYMSENTKYSIGIKSSADVVNVRNNANTSSSILYNTKNTMNYPVVITGTSGAWYKINSDYPLNSGRTALGTSPDYSTSRDYAYIHGDYVFKANTGGTVTQPTNKKGDVNMDGTINILDMYLVRKHIVKTATLTGEQFKLADISGDNVVNILDMYQIRKIFVK